MEKNKFHSFVDKSKDCHTWTAGKFSSGYGQVRVGNRKLLAHRVNWEFEYGPIENGLFILHKCDNPVCVRIEHLFIGTAKDNTLDMMRKQRHGLSKLTDDNIYTIRRLCLIMTRVMVAKIFCVRPSIVGKIANRKCWSHLPEEKM